MAVNTYFKNFDCSGEQRLIEDLIIESIKIYGLDVRYLPRTLIDEDSLWGEDDLSVFNDAVSIEAYIKDFEGFQGEGDFLSRFNLEIRDEITFTIARRRFDEAKSEKILMESGMQMLLETANTSLPSRQFLNTPYDGDLFELETATAEGYAITNNRPLEGDLIFFPLTQKLYEIKFVEHEAVFYQMGRLQTYDIRCELFEYSSERIDTGNTVIDAIETDYSADVLFYEILLEDGDKMLAEDGDSFITEYAVANVASVQDNDYIQQQAYDGIIDFSENNPFSENFRY